MENPIAYLCFAFTCQVRSVAASVSPSPCIYGLLFAVRMIVVYHFDSNCAKNPISLWYVCSVHTVHVPVLDVSFLTIVKLPRMLVAYKMVMCFLHSAQNIFLSIYLFKDSDGVSVHYACLFRFCLSVSRSLSCV